MNRSRVWVTGAGGLIGHALVESAPRWAPECDVVPLVRPALDLTDGEAVRRRWERDQPDLVIHAAALSRSPACEADPGLAERLNVEVTARLAALAAERAMIFFSSDLVFDGARGGYREEDAPNPLSVYARTKVAAEEAVLAHRRNLVVRISLNHGNSPTGDRAFNEDMVRAVRGGATLRLFTDEFRCPMPATVTAQAVWELAEGMLDADPARHASGILHLAGAERLSRWEIGELLARVHPELRGRIEPASLREYRGAPRPPDTSLDCARARQRLRTPLPRFSEWISGLVTPVTGGGATPATGQGG